MTATKFSWIMVAILFIGYGTVIYFIPDELRALGFINIGVFAVMLIASFLIKKSNDTSQSIAKHDVHGGPDVGITCEKSVDVGRDSDSSELSDPDSGSDD